MAKFFFTQWQNTELVVENGEPRGGSAVETMVWMKALHELGHEIVLAKLGEDRRRQLSEFSWIKLVPIYDSTAFKRTFVWFSYRFPKIFNVLRKEKPDFLYTSIPTWHILYIALICKILKIKHIIRVATDSDVDNILMPEVPRHRNWMRNASYKLADLVVAQNDYQFETLKKLCPSTPVEKLFNPIELDNRFLKKKTQLSGYFAWVANFRRQKNLKLLYEVASAFPNEVFKVAGQPLYPLDEETAEYLPKLEKLPNVEFTGIVNRDEILDFLDYAKFLISTSRFEGFSNTFLESMVVGTPILTTSTVNPDGIIDQHGLGLVYKDVDHLSQLLDELTEDQYYSMSRNGIQFVKEQHDHLTLGSQLLRFLEDIR
jgi:glycosyltransferase involved in cell wall biosynthesis